MNGMGLGLVGVYQTEFDRVDSGFSIKNQTEGTAGVVGELERAGIWSLEKRAGLSPHIRMEKSPFGLLTKTNKEHELREDGVGTLLIFF